jgi:hypothetical protein
MRDVRQWVALAKALDSDPAELVLLAWRVYGSLSLPRPASGRNGQKELSQVLVRHMGAR